MTRESLAELDAIEPRLSKAPGSLAAAAASSDAKKELGARLARQPEALSRRPRLLAPDFSMRAFVCISSAKPRKPKNFSINGPVALLKEPIYYYNMGCYEALLGNVHDAEANLQISFKMDSSFRDLAKKDPDLKALHAVI